MKKLISTYAIIAFALSAGAQTSTSTTASDATSSSTSPAQICNQLIEAAKANNYGQVANMMSMPDGKPGAKNKKQKSKFHGMHQEYLAEIQNMSCGMEQIAGDRAMVTAQSSEHKRLIPFIQEEGQWKFDMRTYRAFYRDDKKSKKSKTM